MPRPLAIPERVRKSFSYGEVPNWKDFQNNFHAPDEEGRVIELYEMKLTSSDRIPRLLDEGYYSFNDRDLYALVKKLARKWRSHSGTEATERAGSLASSILYTLGFEWV